MGSSFVEYRGKGFWSRDLYLEHFLACLADVAEASSPEDWLRDAATNWREQSSAGLIGWIHPQFDEYAADEDRRLTVLGLVTQIAQRPGATPELGQTCELAQRLLRGELATDASSPLDYMVRGKAPYPWPTSR